MRAGVVAATLFVLVARVYSRPLGVVGTVSGLPVAPRLLDVDGDAHAMRAARASPPTRADARPARLGVERVGHVEPVRSFTEATTAQQVIDFLHEEIPGYPSAFPPRGDADAALPAVPRVLHVSWATQALPAFAQTYLETWQTHHPTWRVARWTDATMRDFVLRRFPDRVAAYDAFPSAVNRADVFRYMVLFEIGGVYVDLDVEALRSIEPLLYRVENERFENDPTRWRARASCFVGQEPHAHAVVLARGGTTRRACNAVMASAPGLAFWETVLDEVAIRAHATRVTKWNPPTITGPQALTAALERAGFDASVGGCGVVDPPDALFPAMDKSQFARAREICQSLGLLIAEREVAARACPARALRIPDTGDGERNRRSSADSENEDEELLSSRIRVGAPGEVPDARRVCCELSREGFVNPPRETMVRRGAFAVHHWVHTWLDGPDARLSNAWRRRAES